MTTYEVGQDIILLGMKAVVLKSDATFVWVEIGTGKIQVKVRRKFIND